MTVLPPDPQPPARRPYGSVVLPFTVPPAPPRAPRAVPPQAWPHERVPVPPLSVAELRRAARARGRETR
ncbi:hypothetical protein [Actinacidiphila guanduensis]|uniref:Uncharacterized protein n=1 Tax=Actinacidiphila guanduensis TaxID=310781 RepID=A0A1H0E6E2_9ACTN|nr:hypothetical protein [Actinacidiphila guanduensis]SDN77964.1 hypothetical protein SAMN05216259_105491 [Actinacidiphila guanduensis]